MTAAELAEAADANLVTHMTWAQRRVPGMCVAADESLVRGDSGLPCDTFNVVCRARLAAESTRPRVADALAYFRRVARPFSWWVGPADFPADLGDALRAAGLEAAEEELAMAADLDGIPAAPPPPGLRIARVRNREQLGHFALLLAGLSTPPDANVLAFYESAGSHLLAADSPFWFYVGYLDDRPVATAELTAAGGVVGLYGISTQTGYRRRGIGGAMTLRPLLDAKTVGYRTAVLQAAPDAVSVYRRLGFVPTGRYTEYKPAAHAAGAGDEPVP